MVSSSRPSSSSDTARPATGSLPRFVTRALTATRSRPEKYSRWNSTPATLTLAPASSPTATGVTTVPSGKRIPEALSSPDCWKSLISTASSRGRLESSKMPSASLSAGP